MATGTNAAVVVATSASPHARLRPLPVDAVTIADQVWAPRRRINREVSLPGQHELLEETGRLDNFRRAVGTSDGPFQGRYFNDSDVYKWLEAASWSLATDPDPVLRNTVDAVIAEIAAAQRPDGYLNTYFARERADARWTDLDLHELYCAGHLIQAAVAHHRATGATNLLTIARRFAVHIVATFNVEQQRARPWSDGHPEVEMALVELFRETGDRVYLDQARTFIEARGHGALGRPYGRWGPEYHQDHEPFRELSAVAGHAVRSLYLNCGVTDLVAEMEDPALRGALDRLWANMTERRIYVSGGVGARHDGEAFGADYELPNRRAYTETCAAIASVMWNWRLLLLTGEARYADLLETTLYNAVLPGVALDGETYFYQNPLADDGEHRRQPWFGTACCPPNVARLLASLPGYVAAVSGDELWLHLYVEGTIRATLANGPLVAIRQRTDYPWGGEIAIEIETGGEFTLRLRIPAWCENGAALTVNGEPVDAPLTPGTYAAIQRAWQPGDTLRLTLPMPVRRVVAHPYLAETTGRVALMRGPLLYAAEGVDHPGLDPRDLMLRTNCELDAMFQPALLGGVVTLQGEALLDPPDASWQGRLYRTATPVATGSAARSVPLTAIPYYAWANRAPGPMAVWLRQASPP